MGIFSKIRSGLSRTRESVTGRLDVVISGSGRVDDELFDELEEVLVSSDVGVETSGYLMERLREKVKRIGCTKPQAVRGLLMEVMTEELEGGGELRLGTKPSVILVIGVNGVGKTTTIGKLAAYLSSQGKKVLLAAADTFRAAAIEQLEVWAGRAGAEIISQREGADPAAVVYDALTAAKARGSDVVICDTAGRLHNKKNLMDELGKDIARHRPRAARREPRESARARRHHRAERRQSGARLQRRRRAHRHSAHQARRHGARRDSFRHHATSSAYL
jgi:fused signal recognition particle receptor